jgi:hypothetical protein
MKYLRDVLGMFGARGESDVILLLGIDDLQEQFLSGSGPKDVRDGPLMVPTIRQSWLDGFVLANTVRPVSGLGPSRSKHFQK